MNRELYHIASLVASARATLYGETGLSLPAMPHVGSVRFTCLPPKQLFREKPYTAPDADAWLVHLRQGRVRDIKLICPHKVKERHLLGFANTTASAILCFWERGRVTAFVPTWDYDPERHETHVCYAEQIWRGPREAPHFLDNRETFRAALVAIRELALQIDCGEFAPVFEEALTILDGQSECPATVGTLPLPALPEERLRLFAAACRADVFGTMSSRNDSPPYMAHKRGMVAAYEACSNALLREIRLAILYAVNEQTRQEAVISAHAFSANHKKALHKDKKCGCFYCLHIFRPREIKVWIKDRSGTALCPYCGIDAVIGESSGYPITEEFLSAMHARWF